MLDEESRDVSNEADLALTLECLKAVEVLMTSPNLAPTPPETDNRPDQLLVFLIPVLISHLVGSLQVRFLRLLKLEFKLDFKTRSGH